MVDFLLYAASFEASVATRSKMSEECQPSRIQKSGVRLTVHERVKNRHGTVGDTSIRMHLLEHWDRLAWRRFGSKMRLTFVDVRRVRLLPRFTRLLLVAGGRRCLLSSLFLLSRGLTSRRFAAGGGLLLSSFGRHVWNWFEI